MNLIEIESCLDRAEELDLLSASGWLESDDLELMNWDELERLADDLLDYSLF